MALAHMAAGANNGPKRFYARVEVEDSEDGFSILLDNRPVRTPGKAPLRVPTRALAERICIEWAAQRETIDPTTMPLCGLANAAIDRVGGPGRQDVIDRLASYVHGEPLCFRAEGPEDLAAREQATWQPIVDGFNERFRVALAVTGGLAPLTQPDDVVAAVRGFAGGFDDFQLTGFSDGVTHLGSVVVAVAAFSSEIGVEAAFEAAFLEELHQAGRWGLDKEAENRRRAIRGDIETALMFHGLASAN